MKTTTLLLLAAAGAAAYVIVKNNRAMTPSSPSNGAHVDIDLSTVLPNVKPPPEAEMSGMGSPPGYACGEGGYG